MKNIQIHQVARNVALVNTPVILEETVTTRRCFYPSLIEDAAGTWNVRGCITHQRRAKASDPWEEVAADRLSSMKAGEIRKLDLSRDQVRNLFVGLTVLNEAAAQKGLGFGNPDLIVAKRDEVVAVSKQQRRIIGELIEGGHGAEFWEMLSTTHPNLTARLADAELLRRRKAAVAEFENQLTAGKWNEPEWEQFFNVNRWIFGLGLRFQFLSILHNQANYGGADYTRKGEQKGEFLMNTEADERFTVLVEIKRPDTRFFAQGAAYRNGIQGFDPGFTNAISQVQVNTHTWETEGSRRDQDRAKLDAAHIRTISPRSILVCGHTKELDTLEKRNAFELFRCRLMSPDIVTFDELLARARFITRDQAAL